MSEIPGNEDLKEQINKSVEKATRRFLHRNHTQNASVKSMLGMKKRDSASERSFEKTVHASSDDDEVQRKGEA